MRRNWTELADQYITGEESLREMAARLEIPASTLEKRSTREKWPDKRRQYREERSNRARAKRLGLDAAREADNLGRLESLAERLMDEVEKALGDQYQLYRYLVGVGKGAQEEQILGKMDTRAVSELAATLGKLGELMERLIPKEEGMAEDETGLALLPELAEAEEELDVTSAEVAAMADAAEEEDEADEKPDEETAVEVLPCPAADEKSAEGRRKSAGKSAEGAIKSAEGKRKSAGKSAGGEKA